MRGADCAPAPVQIGDGRAWDAGGTLLRLTLPPIRDARDERHSTEAIELLAACFGLPVLMKDTALMSRLARAKEARLGLPALRLGGHPRRGAPAPSPMAANPFDDGWVWGGVAEEGGAGG